MRQQDTLNIDTTSWSEQGQPDGMGPRDADRLYGFAAQTPQGTGRISRNNPSSLIFLIDQFLKSFRRTNCVRGNCAMLARIGCALAEPAHGADRDWVAETSGPAQPATMASGPRRRQAGKAQRPRQAADQLRLPSRNWSISWRRPEVGRRGAGLRSLFFVHKLDFAIRPPFGLIDAWTAAGKTRLP